MRTHTFAPSFRPSFASSFAGLLGIVRTVALAAAAIAGLCALSSTAHAQGGAFGAPGEVVITGDFEGHLRNGWELRLHPSLDYFIAPNVSIGGLVGITYNHGNPSTTTVDLGARVGYNIALAPQASFWPMVGIIYSHVSHSNGMGDGSSTNLAINAPFLFHLVPHFFVGAGPFFYLPLDNGGNSYGLQTVVGGWF